MNLKERAMANEKNCQQGAKYLMYELAMHNALSEPFRSYATGLPVPPEDEEKWNRLIITISSTIIEHHDEITTNGSII